MNHTTLLTNRSALKALFTWAGMILMVSTPLSLQGQVGLLAYEGFDYPADAGLEFNDGGTGWAGAWAWRNSFDGKGSIILNAAWIEAGSLSYGDLQTTGNHLHLYGDLGSIEMARRLAQVITGSAGSTTYISFIGQRVGPLADPILKPDGTPWDDPATEEVETYPWGDNLYPRGASVRFWNTSNGEKFQIGNYSNQSLNEWSIFAGGSRPSGISFSEQAFVVMKIVHNGDETVADDLYLWVNPDLSAGENLSAAQVANPSATEVNDPEVPVDLSNLSWISPWAGGAGGNREWAEMLIDELRIGTTWESVTPTGVAPPTRIISVSGDLSFGEVLVGETAQATLTIGNSGEADLTVNGIAYPEGFSGEWSGVVTPGGSQEVTVTFAPAAAQAYSGTVSVNSNATGGTNTLDASGIGFQEAPSDWAGFPIVNEEGDVNTGKFLGWINVSKAPIIFSYTLNTFLYMEEGFVGPSGAWGYLYNLSTDAPKGGEMTWAGYTVLASLDVETRRFIGWINILQKPYVFSYSFSYWVYLPEEYVAEAGSWAYLFNRN